MTNLKLIAGLFACVLAVGYLHAQSASNTGLRVQSWSYTNYPIYGVAITPHDTDELAFPMAIRPDADGAVTAVCSGNDAVAAAITLTLVAGEFFPCQVIIVLDTGTDAITIHGFY